VPDRGEAEAQGLSPEDAERQRVVQMEQQRQRMMDEAQARQIERAEKVRRREEELIELQRGLTPGDILITGRIGVNGVVNGVFTRIPEKTHNHRPTYQKMRKVDKGPEAIDLGIWWNNGKWYIGMLTEMGSDAAYAFVPSQAPSPDHANGIWTIWNGKTWDTDDRIKAIGKGPRELHVADEMTGGGYEPPQEEYDEEEYMRAYEERLRQEEEQEAAYEAEVAQNKDPDGPEAIPKSHTVPRRIRFRATCPEGHGGCRAGNMCRSCPGECATCQNMRYAHRGVCSASDCFTCNHGYKHMQKHGDGRGICVMAESQYVSYGAAAFVVILLICGIVYVVGYEGYYKKRKPRRSSAGGLLGK